MGQYSNNLDLHEHAAWQISDHGVSSRSIMGVGKALEPFLIQCISVVVVFDVGLHMHHVF